MQMLVKTEAAGGISKSAQISHVDLQTDPQVSLNPQIDAGPRFLGAQQAPQGL